jgi:hypothetical protein
MFKQPLGNITQVPEKFPAQFTAQQVNNIQVSVIKAASGKAKGAYLPSTIDYKV